MNEELEMARRHVCEGEERVERQRQRVAELQRDGHDWERAAELLAIFEDTLACHRRALDIVTREAQVKL